MHAWSRVPRPPQNSIEPETCQRSGEVAVRTGKSYNDKKLIEGTKKGAFIYLGVGVVSVYVYAVTHAIEGTAAQMYLDGHYNRIT